MNKLSHDKELTPRQKTQIRYKKTMPDRVKENQKQLNRIKSKARWALTRNYGVCTIKEAIPILETHGFTPTESGSQWVQIYEFLVSKGLITEENPELKQS